MTPKNDLEARVAAMETMWRDLPELLKSQHQGLVDAMKAVAERLERVHAGLDASIERLTAQAIIVSAMEARLQRLEQAESDRAAYEKLVPDERKQCVAGIYTRIWLLSGGFIGAIAVVVWKLIEYANGRDQAMLAWLEHWLKTAK